MRDYPYECCGLLLGRYDAEGKIVTETYPISNAREESAKRNRFLIEPEELMRGERYAREQRSGGSRVLSFASGFAGRAVAVRSRARVADLLVHHRFDERGQGERSVFVGAGTGSFKV